MEPPPRRLTLAAALGVALPVLFFVASLLYLKREPAEPPVETERPAQVATVPGWVGAIALPGGGRLLVRLSRLHAGELRQAFDREALARRFAPGPGEPWRLVLRLVAEDGAGELALGPLSVVDADGEALRPLAGTQPAAAGEVGDPLAALLSAPERLRPGGEQSLVLWGRAPAPSSASLRGFGSSTELGGAELVVGLEQRSLAPEPDETALARLDRAPAAPPRAAEAPAEGSAREE